jgi:hypothetical protein
VRWALILVALGGCGRFGFDPTGGSMGDDAARGDGAIGGGDGGTDAMTDAPITTGCIAPGTGCAFPGGLPCSCFGTAGFVNASLSESGGNLRITPNANTVGAQGSCLRNDTPFGAGGAILEVSQVVAGAEGLTAMQVGGGSNVFEISVRNGTLIAEDGAGVVSMVQYNPTLMRWWRMRPLNSGVVYEHSPNGVTWAAWGMSTRAPSTAYPFRIIGGTLLGQAAPGFAQIESVNLCGP